MPGAAAVRRAARGDRRLDMAVCDARRQRGADGRGWLAGVQAAGAGGLLVALLGDFSAPAARYNWPLPAHARSRSEEHTSELQSLMRISYAVCCLKKTNTK